MKVEQNTVVHVIFPKGSFGASDDDTLLDRMLRTIAKAASKDPSEWAEKYGTNFENDVFMMHRFCWCERDDCPWCGGCQCPDSAFHYFIDGVEVSSREWTNFFRKMTRGLKVGTPEYEAAVQEANRRRSRRKDPVCDYCLGKGVFATNGAEPGRGAPNFWHKPSGLKVWWYKYIGRGVETNRKGDIPEAEILRIQQECLESLKRSVG